MIIVSISFPICSNAISAADTAVFKAINGGLGCPQLDPVMLALTLFGEGTIQSGLSLFLILFGLIWQRESLRRAGYAGLIAFAASGLAVQIAKLIWSRPRPILALYDVRLVADPLFTNSFPSGHTITSFAFVFAVAPFVGKWRWALYAIAVGTGLSRVYLGVHFPLDVLYGALAGSLIGIASANGVNTLIDMRNNKKQPRISLIKE